MGSKIIKIFLVLICICFGIYGISNAKQVEETQSKVIRVGIMDNKFTTLERTSVSLYGTDTCYICEPDTRKVIFKIPKYQEVLFYTRCGASFVKIPNECEEVEGKNGFVLACPNGILGVKDLQRKGKQALYRGALKIMPIKQNKLYVINLIELEDYLKGVVTNEMPQYFGLEAIKAQAIAARNYAILPRTKSSKLYDVVDSVASQVYFGYNTETEIGNKAVSETEGIVALYNHNPILALYCSASGGYAENYSYAFSDPDTKQFPAPFKPYLIAKPDIQTQKPLNRDDDAYEFYSTKPDSYDIKSSYYRWSREWTREELEQVLQQNLPKQSKTGFVKPSFNDNSNIGTLKNIKVVRRGNSGKIIFLDIITSEGKYRVEKELVIRRLFTKDGKALPSANVVFKIDTDSFNDISTITAYGGGFGHGVGMSQYGASYMALELKKNFDEILKHYYTGIYLGTIPIELSDVAIKQTFIPPTKNAVLVITDRNHLDSLPICINGKHINLDMTRFLNLQHGEIDISEHIKQNKLNTIEYLPICNNKQMTNDFASSNIKMKLYIRFLN